MDYLQQAKGICPRHRLAVPHQEAPILSSFGQQILSHNPADVPMIPTCCCHPLSQPGLAARCPPNQAKHQDSADIEALGQQIRPTCQIKMFSIVQ